MVEPGFEPGFLNLGEVLLGQFLICGGGAEQEERESNASVYTLRLGLGTGEQSERRACLWTAQWSL